MNKIGIIVNPFSGKDLRRIISQATAIGHDEKIKKVTRMINGMKSFGIERVYLMPDSYGLNSSIAAITNYEKDTVLSVEVLDFEPIDQPEDTIKAVEMMKEKGVDCLIVLGGDGTSRLVAKTNLEIPIIPVSTGTNNTYPKFWEGTTVGIAAAYISKNKTEENLPPKDKRIDIYINNHFTDIALVDAVVTNIPYVGSKVISSMDEMKEIIVCRSSPESIGFSSIVGTINICEDDDDFGCRLKIGEGEAATLAPTSSGQMVEIRYSDFHQMTIGSEHVTRPDYDGTIALDGERTITFRGGDNLKFIITRNGPRKVDVCEVLCKAVKDNFFKK